MMLHTGKEKRKVSFFTRKSPGCPICGKSWWCKCKEEKKAKIDVNKLVCYGCCHSVGNADYPGMPSGERPCCFCIRNQLREVPPRTACWYNGSPAVKVPMDCYHSLDMLDQLSKWEEERRSEERDPLEKYLRENYNKQIIDFSLRIDVDDELSFYIHPDGKDGDTKDYIVRNNKLIPKFMEAENVR